MAKTHATGPYAQNVFNCTEKEKKKTSNHGIKFQSTKPTLNRVLNKVQQEARTVEKSLSMWEHSQ